MCELKLQRVFSILQASTEMKVFRKKKFPGQRCDLSSECGCNSDGLHWECTQGIEICIYCGLSISICVFSVCSYVRLYIDRKEFNVK